MTVSPPPLFEPMTLERFGGLLQITPVKVKTIGALFGYLDDCGHKAEQEENWEAAAQIRALHASCLRFLNDAIAAGVVDIPHAVAVTRERILREEMGDDTR